ncbi:PP2C family protein-serine/threonine phosphatase [Bacillus badius]|uniref:Serine phosphatase RsbU, regulator of sigma subunit n=1 Tax=Bacillus badius TaxID=1455 RepID=A0ABR5ATH7_BACBA|nr:PP2C family protein-serine/threonine phosphatase [Bacillus badius]KIL72928.1 Serine phosphatase RsbU, regulator of sigma subunit [Bacillus badius]KIL78056.1 Serine phosphatase RsbU, regulator of sigma subunit [Bacillus badius]MED4717136.1 PP2C family protein-serine/threonine phosphatase [Bacillus badius]
MEFREAMQEKYKEILESYMKDQNEQALYLSQKFSRKSIEHKISPEEIIILHRTALLELGIEAEADMLQSFDILLEVMMAYGIAYREHQNLRTIQQELKSEIEVAANMQQTLLGTQVPEVDCLDIGAISVPARQMSGDYYHFVHDEQEAVSVAIADVIGKGIPAALCMSMIKYSMDSLPEGRYEPCRVLESLNRVVEQNVDPTMFITMFYGMYNTMNHTFYYSSAGHEPGFFYNHQTQQFEELYAKGLLLGVDKKTKYRQFEKKAEAGDIILLMSDGVTECRTKDGFIEVDTLLGYIKKYIHLEAQEIADKVYKELEFLQDFELRDDFTLIILKRIK